MRPLRLFLVAALTAAIAAPAAYATLFDVKILSSDGTNAVYSPCGIGGQYTFPAIPGAAVGEVWKVDVDMSTTPWTATPIQKLGTACAGQTLPPGAPPPPTFPGLTPGPDGSGDEGESGGGAELSDLAGDLPAKAFNQVVTFGCDVDGFNKGRLSVTVTSVAGLSKALRQDYKDVVEDQDAIVLVGDVRIVDRKDRRVKRSALDDADRVSVKGKLLRPSAWKKDEDGFKIPTIRSKRITIVR